MKTIGTQLSYFLSDVELRRNVRLLMRYVGLIVLVIVIFSVLFHEIMEIEGQKHSWVTGFYWTLTVMSTLGFGDITFQSDLGRLFSVIVLMTGILMLLIVLPFAFIRFFYAPWLEAQIHNRAPRELPKNTEGHVIFTARDAIADGLIPRLERDQIPYVVLEADPRIASEMVNEGLRAGVGEIDNRDTYVKMRADHARLVVANRDDMVNTNTALTVREMAAGVPIASVARDDDAIDILELSGSTHVLPLKRWLGEQLANRVNAETAGLYPIGQYEDVKFAELPVHNIPLAGKTIRESRLRETTGVSVIGIWERGVMHSATPERTIRNGNVLVLMGSAEQLDTLNEMLVIYDYNPNPVLLIGGGTVGEAAARALAERGVDVNLVERNPRRCRILSSTCNQVFQGDASDYELIQEAGISQAPAVILTTNDDAINVYLTSYCRRLNPDLRIVTRINHERNLDAIYRAGADFVLSYTTLAVDVIMSILKNKKLLVMGEGVDLFTHDVPRSLAGKRLAESGIGARTGLNVVGIRTDEKLITRLAPDRVLNKGEQLVMIGSDAQDESFVETFA